MIKKVNIQNFRSIENIYFDFTNEPKDIICLLGKNGSGKSNIFRAIGYFFKYINKPYSEEKIIDNSNPYVQKCIISIVFDIGLLAKKAERNAQLKSEFERISKYLKENKETDSFSESEIELTMTQNRDGTIKWNISDKSICTTIKSIFPIYYIDTRRLDLYTWAKLWEIISELSASKPDENYKNILDKAFKDIYGDKYSTSKDIIEQIFEKYGISLDKYHFEDRYKNAFTMRFGGDQFVYDGHSLDYYSDGTSSYSYLRLLIALVPKISEISCKYPVLLIDEPEIGLHNELISELVDCFNYNIKNNAFCMISTHSPKLIADLCNKKSNYSIYRISRKGFYSLVNKMNTSWIDNSKHKVTVRETECYFYDSLVYVEGETEIQLFNHPKLFELFPKLRRVHFYSSDSNDEMIKAIHPEYLNLGIPYKIIVDMDKIIKYNPKINKFYISKEHTVNPIFINQKKEKESYRFYGRSEKQNRELLRTYIKTQMKKAFTSISGKNYIDNVDFNKLMFAIIYYCNLYNVIVNWSTIEGCLITYENICDFIDFVDKKGIYHTRQHKTLCLEKDAREKTVLILYEFDGKSEFQDKVKIKGIEVSKRGKKTGGWISEWLTYYFELRIDTLSSINEKKERLKKDFPQLFDTLQIIENMV